MEDAIRILAEIIGYGAIGVMLLLAIMAITASVTYFMQTGRLR